MKSIVSSFHKSSLLRETRLLLVFLLLLLLSCRSGSNLDGDLLNIERIENKLLPSVIVKGVQNQGYNILERMEHYKVPGVSIAFLNRGKIVWAKGYGYTSSDSLKAVNELTLFQAASISKPVAAMAALSLVESGKIVLDQDVNSYLEGWDVKENKFTEEEKVSLRRILSHTAGLTVHGFAGYQSDAEVPDILQVLEGKKPANSGRIYADITPGTKYRYSGGGYTVMQKMLVDITGEEFPEIMDQYVISKIGMESSTYQQPLPEPFWGNAAYGHSSKGKTIQGRWHTYPEMAAAGLWTTPTDLLKYAMEVQLSYAGESNQIISQKMTRQMLTPQMNSHALGPGVGGSGDSITFGHGGANAGFRCQLRAYTKLGQGVAVMTNGDNGGKLIGEILRAFSEVYEWDGYKPEVKSVAHLDPADLELFAGQYLLKWEDQDLIVEFSVKDKYLQGIQLWQNFAFEIFPETENQFFNKDDGSSFSFIKSQSGVIQEVVIREGYQEYTFSRL